MTQDDLMRSRDRLTRAIREIQEIICVVDGADKRAYQTRLQDYQKQLQIIDYQIGLFNDTTTTLRTPSQARV